jgi:hypothetical protein
MSRNFELMQQTARDFGATSIPQPNGLLSEVHDTTQQNKLLVNWGQVPRKETPSLVRRIRSLFGRLRELGVGKRVDNSGKPVFSKCFDEEKTENKASIAPQLGSTRAEQTLTVYSLVRRP